MSRANWGSNLRLVMGLVGLVKRDADAFSNSFLFSFVSAMRSSSTRFLLAGHNQNEFKGNDLTTPPTHYPYPKPPTTREKLLGNLRLMRALRMWQGFGQVSQYSLQRGHFL
eukprot:TRINITY_DN2744_c0_g1_i13.p1 TRINITY_DN2744_c0_g1~~TRINITY_DN2744_c0_g1_i13.p1  ORF type:complete len:111 (+),score=25.16 TRINITY_DN2744_c0_g1_i13:190-522(+)